METWHITPTNLENWDFILLGISRVRFYQDDTAVVQAKIPSAAAAAAKSFQSCPTLCNPIDGSPPGSAVPGILQARTLE